MQEARNSMANFPQEGGSKDLKLLSLFSKHGIDMHINQVIFRKILSILRYQRRIKFVQVSNYEIVVNFFHISHNLT